MFEGVKAFYQKHKVPILVIGGGAVAAVTGVVLSKKISGYKSRYIRITDELNKSELYAKYIEQENESLKYLESIGGEIIDGCCYASKEVANRFMEEKGKTYQLSILSPEESAIWISPYTRN
jgi:hypothetical protein